MLRGVRIAGLGALLAASWLAAPAHAGTGPVPTDLAVDGRTDQLAASPAPRFSWLPQTTERNDVQTGYQIVVRTEAGSLVWDSGRVPAAEQSTEYGGPPLVDGASYTWAVRTWHRFAAPSAFAAASFDVGLRDQDWGGAEWIRRVTTGPDSIIDYTLARNQFVVSAASPVRRARAYIAAEGEWQLHVNGRTVDTQYDYQMPGEGFYTVEDITPDVRAGALAVGVKYAAWPTTEGEPRPEGPVPYATNLSQPAAAGSTRLNLANVTGYVARENLAIGAPDTSAFEIATIASIGGSTVNLTAPLGQAHPSGSPVVSENGPSGLIVKIVVEHADGSVQTFGSNRDWRVTKDTSERNDVVQLRSKENAGSYVEYVDGRGTIPGWDAVGYDASAWPHAASLGPHPLPNPGSCANYLSQSSPCGFTHLTPMLSKLSYSVVRPVSVYSMRDGSVLADFGTGLVGIPTVRLEHGQAGRPVTLLGSYRLMNTTLAAPAVAGTATVAVASVCRFQPGDRITVDAPADGYGAGHPEVRTVASVRGDGCRPGTLTLTTPLAHTHTPGRWVEGSRAGTSSLDTQATDLSFHYAETDGAQTTSFFVGQGFRYLQVSGAKEPLSAEQIWVVATHEDAAPEHAASFTSSDPTLNAVFALMQRSALYAGQQEFNDSPDRQDGQFLGDAVNESFATMESLGEQSLTRQALLNFTYSQQRYWLAEAPGPGSSYGDINAVYPDGDGKRDIPDFTEMFPEWAWRYYWLTGDRAGLGLLYPTMRNVATYVSDSIAASGAAAGLVYELAGGSGQYRHGLVDWPPPMRYDTTVLNRGVATVINMRAVEVFRDVARAARALGRTADATTYDGRATKLITAINHKLVGPTGYYLDGLLPTTGSPIPHASEHDQTFALTYGVAPETSYRRLGNYIAAQGMRQGPLDLGQLEQALITANRPDALVSVLTDPRRDGPAKILAEGGTLTWEQWNPGCMSPGGRPGGGTAVCLGPAILQQSHDSFSHGWGAVGIVGILRGLLGITVTSPGAATVTIAPPRSGLTFARGTEWTARGPVNVDWQHDVTGFRVTVDIPDNVTATVAIPGHSPVMVGAGHTTVTGA